MKCIIINKSYYIFLEVNFKNHVFRWKLLPSWTDQKGGRRDYSIGLEIIEKVWMIEKLPGKWKTTLACQIYKKKR